jgi:hypothetical protein
MRIPIKPFSLTVAIFSGVSLFLIAWWGFCAANYFPDMVNPDMGGTTSIPGVFGYLYYGYEFTPIGSLYGFIWGFVDLGVAAAIFAWLFNKIADKMES